MTDYLEFEKPLMELEEKIERIKGLSKEQPKAQDEIQKLQKRAHQLQREIYTHLTPIQTLQIARHPNRPSTLDYLGYLVPDFLELHGDRAFADDAAIVGGIGRLDGAPVVVIGHQKGRNVKERVKRNFGMPHPEGYRKAQRLMLLAERFGRPVITFIDTPGAYPGLGAEERGQSEAIAASLRLMARLAVPIVAVVIGEGGSGGALALGVADRILMLEHSVYSVISPEGCAAILWKSADKAVDAADALKMTAKDLLALGVIDEIVPEPLGCAHRNHAAMAAALKKSIGQHLAQLLELPSEDLLATRYEKFRKMGVYQ
ncbi:MAG: acetyl-CoA carboxylase carboxyltransferase subunit alpha [Nitrospirae bacterium RIFCSPHIGHO2_01_FULL_66_17]|nr:MAG: acetyl-CoA carboxylase carboxyltransferase subunit alpha [Nitrospirae bacterium RIFCSPHIGHO2_01_FULL_66_17]